MQVVVRQQLGDGMGNQAMMEIKAETPPKDWSCHAYARYAKQYARKYALKYAKIYAGKYAKYVK
jgi:hypothetical protein